VFKLLSSAVISNYMYSYKYLMVYCVFFVADYLLLLLLNLWPVHVGVSLFISAFFLSVVFLYFF